MSKAKSFTLILVRTGSTEWDRENRIGGGVDLPLVECGDAIPFESHSSPSAIVCGPDECSRASAEAAGKPCGVKVRSIGALADVQMGLWEGVTHEELEERCPSTFKQWRERPDSISAPNGENLSEAESRLTGEIHRAAMKIRGENPVLMVVLRPMAYALVRARMLGRPHAELWSVLEEAPAGAETFQVSAGALAPSPKRISA